MRWFAGTAKGFKIPVLRVEELPRPAYVFGRAPRSAPAARLDKFSQANRLGPTQLAAGAPVDSYRHESDKDPVETREWLDSLSAVVEHEGKERARFLLERTIEDGRRQGVAPVLPLNTDYVNTVRLEDQPEFPGDEELERRIRRIIRWNAAASVHRANKKFDGLGGHISTYASSATLYEIGFNHFFRGKDGDSLGDQVY